MLAYKHQSVQCTLGRAVSHLLPLTTSKGKSNMKNDCFHYLIKLTVYTKSVTVQFFSGSLLL